MTRKTVGAAKFKAECLKLIEEMGRDGQAITITKRGRPVAVLSPLEPVPPPSLFGAMRGSVLRYDDPFEPAADASDWNALR